MSSAGQNRRGGPCRSITYKTEKVRAMSLGSILLIVLVLAFIGVIPVWPHSHSWGYWPGGGLGIVAVILVVLLLMGRI
jgi:membrane protein YdbS with pleckstrin-like domain